ncbi:MAG: hypothetical protein LBD23_02545 [Oscillospiraceae bacterium]|jgi:hypothetical protein|nr:hypothetical protein [Oscillospiraceae bacterium]
MKNLPVIIISASAILLLAVSVVIFFISSNSKETVTIRIIASIESIIADWEALEHETMNITITPDMNALYTPESLRKLSRLLGGNDDLQISIYYTNIFNSFNRNGHIIVTKNYIGVPFIDNEGYNIYYYFMLSSNGKVYDIISGSWK